MGIIKKWIAKIFNITEEDLPGNETINGINAFNKMEIDAIVSQKVDEKIQIAIKELKFAEKQVWLAEKTSDQSAVITSHDQISLAEDPNQVSKPIISDAIDEEVVLPIIYEKPDSHADAIIEEPRRISAKPGSETEDESVEPIAEIQNSEAEINSRKIEQSAITEKADVSGILPIQIHTDNEEIHPLIFDSGNELDIKPAVDESIAHMPIEKTLPFLESIEGKDLRLGIDFGTTTTAISLKIGEEFPEAIKIGKNGEKFIPSIAYVRPGSGSIEERIVIGEDAEAYNDQDHVIRSVKRCIGCKGGNCRENYRGITSTEGYPFPWCKGDGRLHVYDDVILPENIIYFIIKEAIKRTIERVRDEKYLDLNWENITSLPLLIGCGAVFNFEKREIIKKVANRLGFTKITIENVAEEPILAGFTFSRFMSHPEGRTLIYDFGGGTLDVAVMDVDRIENLLRVTVISTAGENWLGGDDIDTLIYRHFIDQIAKQLNVNSQELIESINPIDLLKIRNMSKKAKERLSYEESFNDILLLESYGRVNLDLSRADFEKMPDLSSIIESSFDAIRRACQIAYVFENAKEGILIDYSKIVNLGIRELAKKIDRVLLVGGVTNIPLIRARINSVFGQEKIVDQTIIDPISAVSIGGSYPKEPQHYSIFTPPFGLYIKSNTPEGKKNESEILLPYTYLNFHKNWHIDSSAEFSVSTQLLVGSKDVELIGKRVCDKQGTLLSRLNSSQTGDYTFFITLDGQILYETSRGEKIYLCDYPCVHPVQKEIRDAKEKRNFAQNIQRIENENEIPWTIRMMMDN